MRNFVNKMSIGEITMVYTESTPNPESMKFVVNRMVLPNDSIDFRKKELVKDKYSIDENIKSKKFKVIDARSKDRFLGKVPEPRKGLRSGKIENSFCIPFNYCINDCHWGN